MQREFIVIVVGHFTPDVEGFKDNRPSVIQKLFQLFVEREDQVPRDDAGLWLLMRLLPCLNSIKRFLQSVACFLAIALDASISLPSAMKDWISGSAMTAGL